MSKWEKESEREIFKCPIFSIAERRLRSPNGGKSHSFYVMEGRDWVNVVPITKSGEVVMVDQYRFGTERASLEVPGGIIEAGEDPQDAAIREMREETGYGGGRVRPIGWTHPNPAIQGNRCFAFVAEGVERLGEQKLDETEDMRVKLVKLADVPRLIADGTIHHALIIAAFYFYEREALS